MLRLSVLILAFVALAVPAVASAASVDVSVGSADITLAPALSSYPAGMAVRVYVRIHNAGQEDAVASAELSVGGVAIGQASPVPVRAGGSAETWVDWVVPNARFSIVATVSAAGDGQRRNNAAETDQYMVSAPAGRDIFTPPPGRGGAAPTSSSGEASSSVGELATPTEPILPPPPVSYAAPAPVPQPAAAPLDGYSWIPYVLIALGAIGFAWGMRGRRRVVHRPAPLVAAPVPTARAPRRRPAKVYRPKLVVERAAAAKPRRPARRKAAPLAPEQQS